MNELQNLLSKGMFAIGVLTGSETQDLDTVIRSGNSLAVKARLLKGNYQLTEKSLELAIHTNDPNIVNYIIDTGQKVTSRDVSYALSLLNLDQSCGLRQCEIIKNLINAIRNKNDKLDHSVLMCLIKEDKVANMKFFLGLNVEVTQEHIDKASNLNASCKTLREKYPRLGGTYIIDESGTQVEIPKYSKYSDTLKILIQFYEKKDTFKNFRIMGESARCANAFFVNTSTGPKKIPTEVMFKIAGMAENTKYPLDDKVKEKIFYKKY